MDSSIKIFINNFPNPVHKLVSIGSSGKAIKKTSPTILTGFDMGGSVKDLMNNAMSKFFLSLILYDEVIVTDSVFKKIILCIGLENCLVLLETKKIKLIYDKVDFELEFLNRSGSRLKLTNNMVVIPLVYYVDRNFKEFSNKKSLKSKFVQYLENSLLEDVQSLEDDADNSIYQHAFDELIKEVASPEISNKFLHGVETIQDMDPFQATKAMRLLNTLKGFSFQQKSGADVILQDAFSKDYLNTKLAFILKSESVDKIDFFSEITKIKGIPDIYHLLKTNVLDIHDIVRFTASNESKFFRDWYTNEDISKEDIYLKLMSNKKGGVLSKGVRWLYPNIVGLVNPVLGGIASGIDSFIVEKIANGWSPNIFLDDFLKSNIDLLIEKQERSIKKQEIIKRFGSVKPNTLCPCQSGLKFKKCHGYD
ncbi:hypothetical protein OLEAN_C15470 [Oleispira antarctica RB-8]|uniref:SEC-C motif domain protein n=1 Tax=Oleispira antarctica RB-8 TaxID=698738 RepID=R4YR24_OLEAN|nr:hypothetical protein OLEAN_C15470 [Oleispira antarctica RB-8]